MEILVLTSQPLSGQPCRTLPALELLPHTVRVAGYQGLDPVSGPGPDLVLVDARRMLADARNVCRTMRQTGLRLPVIAVVEESGLVAISADWGLDDVILADAGPTEVEARMRLAASRLADAARGATNLVTSGALVIDPDTYAAKLKGNSLDLTYKEFELLKFLAQHPGRVFTREQLLQEVWGYDYFGGPRTVDVHVRRLRAKLGSEYESMITTVRQVGYKLALPPRAKTQALVEDLETLLV